MESRILLGLDTSKSKSKWRPSAALYFPSWFDRDFHRNLKGERKNPEVTRKISNQWSIFLLLIWMTTINIGVPWTHKLENNHFPCRLLDDKNIRPQICHQNVRRYGATSMRSLMPTQIGVENSSWGKTRTQNMNDSGWRRLSSFSELASSISEYDSAMAGTSL